MKSYRNRGIELCSFLIVLTFLLVVDQSSILAQGISDLGSQSRGISRTAMKITTEAKVSDDDYSNDQIPKQALKQIDPDKDRIPFDDL
ncbi:MAG: hypothetical protein CMN21_07690, partial [Rubinisphaera sp.]